MSWLPFCVPFLFVVGAPFRMSQQLEFVNTNKISHVHSARNNFGIDNIISMILAGGVTDGKYGIAWEVFSLFIYTGA